MATLYNSKYYHRDLSWLRFNHRVLQEAADKRNPLYERIKFLAIFSSNLDEFFRVRVSDIRRIKSIEKPFRKKLITKPNRVLKEIKALVDEQQDAFGRIFSEEIIPALEKENIFLINHKRFTETHKLIVQNYFEEELQKGIEITNTNVNTNNGDLVENEAIYLVAEMGESDIHFVKIKSEVPRFFEFPMYNNKYAVCFVEDILKYILKQTPKGELPINYYAIKISRDAELYIEDEFSGDLKSKIKAALPKRQTGQATRVLIDPNMPESLQKKLKKSLDVNETDIIEGGVYHNFKDFFSFPNPTEKNLSNPDLPPLDHPVLTNCNSIFDVIDEKDQLLHYPYQSFEPLIRLVEEAANDPTVKQLKITIYRAADESRLNEAIVLAARNGIAVTVFLEVKARFDEQNNLKWGAIFDENGANVIYSYPDIKVHSKIMYIEREIDGKRKAYAYIATGNFNEKTARLYTDFGLMTAHKKITKELNKVFLILDGSIIVPKTKKLIVSPFTTRVKFAQLVNGEISKAAAGEAASIILKMNSLEDKEMIKLLYRASKAGVKIRLLIRGICCLVPGIKGQSENIRIISVIDRFLEHGRVYIFGSGEDRKMYIGSADWMTRNLSHRIEVVTPILDSDIAEQIMELIEIQLADNVKARLIDAKQKNEYVPHDTPAVQSQLETYDYFRKKLAAFIE